jgi:hypothetical protein
MTQVERLKITESNVRSVLRILDIHEIRSSFFVEISLAENLLDLLKIISAQGHEVAFYNKNSTPAEIENTKKSVEDYLEKQIKGFRQKDGDISTELIKSMGFSYISNTDHSNIMFPFKRLKRSCEITEINGLSVVPETISPYSQIPYNDFAFQVLPMKYYQNMVFETLKSEDFVLVYLESWQFTDMEKNAFKVPFYRRYNSGKKMEDKLEEFLIWINEKELATSRMKDYIF